MANKKCSQIVPLVERKKKKPTTKIEGAKQENGNEITLPWSRRITLAPKKHKSALNYLFSASQSSCFAMTQKLRNGAGKKNFSSSSGTLLVMVPNAVSASLLETTREQKKMNNYSPKQLNAHFLRAGFKTAERETKLLKTCHLQL